jgi:uncharacterized protein DUF4912/tetratricopeptide repeat protein
LEFGGAEMSTTRAELEGLDREALIARADAAGVARARILTRPELVDELLLRSATDHVTKERARGLFGRARDLLARLVERGLNKPEAADRIRAVGRPLDRPSAPAALPTLTLAEIYVAQGYRARAMETLERVLSAEPEHAAAHALLARLRDASFPVAPPKMAPEGEEDDLHETSVVGGAPPGSPPAAGPPLPVPAPPAEPSYMLDDSPLPPRYDVDECVAIAVDPRTVYVYWEVREQTMEGLRARSAEAGLTIRVVAVEPSWNGPHTSVRDCAARSSLGELFVRDLPAGSVVRAAVGAGGGTGFVPIAHSAPLETPPSNAAPGVGTKLVCWTLGGALPVAARDGAFDAAGVAAVVTRMRKDSASQRRLVEPTPRAPSAAGTTRGLLGASEQWAGAGLSRA